MKKFLVSGLLVSTCLMARSPADWQVYVGAGAPEDVKMGKAVAKGNGCPSPEVVMAKDRMSISILFNDFSIEDLNKYRIELKNEIKRVDEENLKKKKLINEAQKFFNNS